MGLIKAALIGGVAYWAIKSSKEKNEGYMAQRTNGGCGWGHRARNTDSNTETRGVQDEKAPAEPYEPALNPPSYSTGANAYYYDTEGTYYNDTKHNPATFPEPQTQAAIEPPASPPYQQMTFVKPAQPYRLSDVAHQYRTKGVEAGAVSKGPSEVSRADMVVEQAMMHLQSGQPDKARELLGRAMQS